MPGEAGGASDLGQLWAAVDAFFPSIYLSSQVRLPKGAFWLTTFIVRWPLLAQTP